MNLEEFVVFDNKIEGQLSIRSERLNGSLTCNLVCTCTGELPLEIIRMKAKGVKVDLYGNSLGFTLPMNIGELGGDITKLDLSSCSLAGPRSTRSELFIFATEMDVVFYAGPLPKVLPISLEVLNLGDGREYNGNKFTGGIPPEWGALTNLKDLKMAYCGLDGKPLSIRTERLRDLIDLKLCRAVCQAASRKSSRA